MSIVFMFPGQGSQAVGMGAEVFDAFPDEVKAADGVLGYSVKQLCLEDPDGNINLTQYTQPALYTVNSLTYLSKVRESGAEPAFVAGHSLGEYTALFAAGAFDFVTGVRLVQKRGALMGMAKGGGMAAVIGMGPDQVKETLAGSSVDTVDVANFNSPGQTILSGPVEDLERLQEHFEAAGARRYIPLKVSAAFHSRYMAEAEKKFAGFLEGIEFQPTRIPVIANYTARPYEDDKIRENLAKQISNSVRWQESVEYLLQQGATEFEEVGPGAVLAKLIGQIQKG